MKIFYFILFILFHTTPLVAQETLTGKITATDTQEELIGVSIIAFQNGNLKGGTSTGIDGNYKLQLPVGNYDIEIRYVGMEVDTLEGVQVPQQINKAFDIQLKPIESKLADVITVCYGIGSSKKRPLKIDSIPQTSKAARRTFTPEKIRQLPTKDISGLAVAVIACFPSKPEANDSIVIDLPQVEVVDYKVPLVDVDVCGTGYKKPKATAVLEINLPVVEVVAYQPIIKCIYSTGCGSALVQAHEAEASSNLDEDVDEGTTTDELSLLKMQVFPNPATDFINVKLPDAADQLFLFDSQGRSLRQLTHLPKGTHRISLYELPAGHYVLSASIGSRVFSASFIKHSIR